MSEKELGQNTLSDIEKMRRQIEHRRIDRGFSSRRKLAEAAGVSHNTLDNLFKEGRKELLYVDDAARIADALGCAVEDLLGKRPYSSDEERQESEETRLLRSRPELAAMLGDLSTLSEDQVARMRAALNQILPMFSPPESKKGEAHAS